MPSSEREGNAVLGLWSDGPHGGGPMSLMGEDLCHSRYLQAHNDTSIPPCSPLFSSIGSINALSAMLQYSKRSIWFASISRFGYIMSLSLVWFAFLHYMGPIAVLARCSAPERDMTWGIMGLCLYCRIDNACTTSSNNEHLRV